MLYDDRTITNVLRKLGFTPNTKVYPWEEHWVWRGPINAAGNPLYRNKSVRRMLCTYFEGEVPDKDIVKPVCQEPGCVNPKHMMVVPRGQQMNEARSWTKMRGRPPIIDENGLRVIKLMRSYGHTIADIAEQFQCSHGTISKALKALNIREEAETKRAFMANVHELKGEKSTT